MDTRSDWEGRTLEECNHKNDEHQVPSVSEGMPFVQHMAYLFAAKDIHHAESKDHDTSSRIRRNIRAAAARWCKTGSHTGIEQEFKLCGLRPETDASNEEFESFENCTRILSLSIMTDMMMILTL